MDEMLDGMALANQRILCREEGTHRMLRRNKKEAGKVKIIIGNGGGHEPGSIGWIGYGMYDMASMGEMYLPPSQGNSSLSPSRQLTMEARFFLQ